MCWTFVGIEIHVLSAVCWTDQLFQFFSLSRLDALDPNAYAAFQASNDLKDVVERVKGGGEADGGGGKPGMKKNLSIRANIMTPVKPMLVRICTIVGVHCNSILSRRRHVVRLPWQCGSVLTACTLRSSMMGRECRCTSRETSLSTSAGASRQSSHTRLGVVLGVWLSCSSS